MPVTSLSSQLMIRVESLAGPVPIEAFLKAADEMSFVASEVGRQLSGEKLVAEGEAGANGTGSHGAKGWHIADVQIEAPPEDGTSKARQHHAVALLLMPPENNREVPQRVREGVRDIAAQCEERPEGFSDSALRALRRVGQSVGRKIRVTLSAGQGQGEAIALDESLARHIDGWLNGQIAAVGSVEGKLELISIHNRMRFTIYGRDGLRVECLFPETMLTQVKAALGERVCLRGPIRYRRDGKPATVEVQVLKSLRQPAQIPALEQLCAGSIGASI
jgi:hypothetical protein